MTNQRFAYHRVKNQDTSGTRDAQAARIESLSQIKRDYDESYNAYVSKILKDISDSRKALSLTALKEKLSRLLEEVREFDPFPVDTAHRNVPDNVRSYGGLTAVEKRDF
ncbi:hypothetical protein SLS58_004823 [Diplodia intermedia]|uniref:Uncharacterized protein n=1 Tax=Diplodia intermedia TaxID=856260 RepID=A0ABR3TS89_9PEZI